MIAAVTGIDGFLGQYLKKELEENHIMVLPISIGAGYDIRSLSSLEQVPHFDVLIHLAAVSYVPDSYVKPHLFYDTNVNGTLNVLEQVRRHQARMIYISSYVYGQPHYQPIDETHPVQAFNPYAQSKLMAEELCAAYHRDFKVPCVIFRPFNIYGYGQAGHFLLPKIVSHHLQGEVVKVFDVRPKRDYVHAKDVALAMLKAVDYQDSNCTVFNLGAGKSYSIPEIGKIVEDITGKELKLENLHRERPAEILDTVCNNQKAKDLLQWQPSVTLREGIENMILQMTSTTYHAKQ